MLNAHILNLFFEYNYFLHNYVLLYLKPSFVIEVIWFYSKIISRTSMFEKTVTLRYVFYGAIHFLGIYNAQDQTNVIIITLDQRDDTISAKFCFSVVSYTFIQSRKFETYVNQQDQW